MKIMIFCDLENFRYSIREKFDENKKVDINFKDFHFKLFEKVVEYLNSKIHNPHLIRAYIYTGQYTDGQISKAKHNLKYFPDEQKRINDKVSQNENNNKIEKNERKIKILERELVKLKLKCPSNDRIEILRYEIEQAEYRKKAQEQLFKQIDYVNFLELKSKPLKYSRKDFRFLQKGTDVEMAVDIVNFAHFDNYDVAIVCTGDLDLLESCRLIKTLGKTFVLVSHNKQVSDKMIQASDYYLDIENLTDSDLKEIAFVG